MPKKESERELRTRIRDLERKLERSELENAYLKT